MKRLFLQIYGVIVGSLLLGLILLNYSDNRFYAEEIEGEYLKKAAMFTQAIQRDIANGLKEADSLQWWQKQLREHDEISLEIKPRQTTGQQAYIKKISVTEALDRLEVVHPFDQSRALHFTINDPAAPEAIWAYYLGYLVLYVFMAALLYLLTRFLYQHLEAIRQQAKRVANGDYSTPLATARIAAFIDLHNDLNRMMQSLADKTRDNHVLTAAIHHELRTPLTRLRLALDMALATRDAKAATQLLSDMDLALNDLSQLMEDVLTLSRLRLDHQTAPVETVPLDQLILSCIAAHQDARIQTKLLACTLQANRPLLDLALNNLLSNARKHAKHRITIELRQDEQGIELIISDDGPGIPKAARESVKRAFVQIRSTRQTALGGVGLGLAIADLALKESQAQWQISESGDGGTAIVILWRTLQIH